MGQVILPLPPSPPHPHLSRGSSESLPFFNRGVSIVCSNRYKACTFHLLVIAYSLHAYYYLFQSWACFLSSTCLIFGVSFFHSYDTRCASRSGSGEQKKTFFSSTNLINVQIVLTQQTQRRSLNDVTTSNDWLY